MEKVVLLDEGGEAIGSAFKDQVHGRDTPLHLAFSCHVSRRDGAVLLTRRALTKKTWPGTWTNTFCGHPMPGEPLEDAVRRRAEHELGLELANLRLALPDFRYRAVDASGVVENEVCPVFVATTDSIPALNHDEVMEVTWARPQDVARAATATPWAFSPWFVEQLAGFSLIDSIYPQNQVRV